MIGTLVNLRQIKLYSTLNKPYDLICPTFFLWQDLNDKNINIFKMLSLYFQGTNFIQKKSTDVSKKLLIQKVR